MNKPPDHYAEAERRTRAADYKWQDSRDGEAGGSLYEAAVAQVHATLALIDELRQARTVTD